jgi:hypothetical protein
MKQKTTKPGASAKKRLQWRPGNALSVGAASRAAWSKKSGARSRRNPRGPQARRVP